MVAAVIFVVAVNLAIIHKASPFIVRKPEAAPAAPVAIVLGASVHADGTPSPMLADRLDTALLLYQQGKVKTLLLSAVERPGDEEVAVMRRYLVERAVPDTDLLTDPQGFDTHASMLRAQTVFHIESALIPSQPFHLARAVYLAHSLGISAVGVPADIRPYSTTGLSVREWGARVKAFLQVSF
jgi:SanA protein